MKFFKCAKCGQIVAMVKETGVPIICCGQPMDEIVANTVDAAVEKHVPVYRVEGNKVVVNIGEADHPMLDEHYIEWVAIQTKLGGQRKTLAPGDKPNCCFRLCDNDELVAVYCYCNLHGLWKA
ncbi:MAG: desulfoferrodoxin family protein [Coriobacteriia bacterium]|nr:desulfoferrodoxin family protein [Coriobacteriia bacterium]